MGNYVLHTRRQKRVFYTKLETYFGESMENTNKEDWAPGFFKVNYVEPEFRKIVKNLEEVMRDLEQTYKSVERFRTMLLSRDYTHGDLK